MKKENLKRYSKSSLLNITWEFEGLNILTDDKLCLSTSERERIKFLLSKEVADNDVRKKLWLILSGAKKEMLSNKDYYKNLVEYSQTFKSLNEHQINMDLKRTFPEDPYFRKETSLQKLKNVLICYSIRNSSIGYCQGFNFIAARLLKVLDNEEEVFWVLTQILEDILPINYYSELSGMITDCAILVNLLEKYIPDLHSFLIDNGFEINLNNFIHKWFVSLFVQNFSDSFSLVIWDYLFLEGNIVIFKAALAVLQILKKDIMSNNSFENIYRILNVGPYEINDFNHLIFYLAFRKFEFDKDFLALHRNNLGKPIIDNIRMENEVKLGIKHKNSVMNSNNPSNKFNTTTTTTSKKCDRNLPYCLKNLEEDFQHQIISFLSFRVKTFPSKIIDNFFCSGKKFLFVGSYNNKEKEYDDILIERKFHTCTNYITDSVETRENSDDLKKSKNKVEENTKKEKNEPKKSTNFFTNFFMNVNLFTTLKKDETFKEANKILSTSFKPKPFADED